jgi:hypothetical protein
MFPLTLQGLDRAMRELKRAAVHAAREVELPQ